jgi:hypothetical protein
MTPFQPGGGQRIAVEVVDFKGKDVMMTRGLAEQAAVL